MFFEVEQEEAKKEKQIKKINHLQHLPVKYLSFANWNFLKGQKY